MARPRKPAEPPLPGPATVPEPPKTPGVEELKRGFDAWLIKRGKAPTTRRLYQRNAVEFLEWLEQNPPLTGEQADAIVARYFQALEEQQPGNSGNLRRTTAARAFMTFMGRPPQMYRSQTGPYGGLRKGQGARYLNIEDTVSVLDAVRERGIRQEVAIVGLLLISEMSPRLLCSLTVADVAGLDVNGQRWRIDRGSRSWNFMVSTSIGRVVEAVASERPGPRSALFADDEGRALMRQSLDTIMKGIGDAAGIPDLAAYRLTMSRSKRSGQGVGWDALPGAARGRARRR